MGIPTGDHGICTFWYCFNEKLISLYDHVTQSNYKPIVLDKNWWNDNTKYISKYNVKTLEIFEEFHHLKVRCLAMKEIIYQSNKSLRPMVAYKQELNVQRPLRTHKKYLGKQAMDVL